MNETKHKLAFIGPRIIHESFSQMDETWDMQQAVETLEDFDRDLSREVPIISRDTSVIILFSSLFKTNKELFASLVSYVAPYSVTCILIPERDLLMKSEMDKYIKDAQIRDSKESNEVYSVNTPYFYVAYENPQAEIFNSIKEFTQSNVIAPEIKNAVRVMLPNDQIPIIQDYHDDSESDRIIIPKADENAFGKVITVTSSKGGSGKSTVSIGLAMYIAQASKISAQKGLIDRPYKVILIDLDTRDGQLGFLSGLNGGTTIMDIFSRGGSTPSREVINSGICKDPKTGVDYILAVKRPRNAMTVPASTYAHIVQELRSLYDIIILDTSVNYLDPLAEQVAYPIADEIILVSDMGIASILGCTRWIKEMISSADGPELNEEKISVVINKAMQGVGMEDNKLMKALEPLPILGIIPSMPKIVTYLANTNSLELMIEYKALNAGFKDVVDSLLDVELTQPPASR